MTQLLFVLVLQVAAGQSQVLDGVIVHPDWVQTPTALQMTPPLRTELPSNADVQMTCRIGEGGRLESCHIDREVPAGWGYAETALKAARYYRHRTILQDGRRVTGLPVRVTLRWREAE